MACVGGDACSLGKLGNTFHFLQLHTFTLGLVLLFPLVKCEVTGLARVALVCAFVVVDATSHAHYDPQGTQSCQHQQEDLKDACPRKHSQHWAIKFMPGLDL